LRGIKEKTLATLVAVTESKRASQECGCCRERVREHTKIPQPTEKRGRRRRRRGESVQISEF
jgi:cytidine deaminase